MTKFYDLTLEYTTIPEGGSSSDDNFILENVGNQNIMVTFGSGDGYHLVKPTESLIRAGVSGELKVRAQHLPAKMVISGV